ncbi:hypothetical protein RDABS01_021022 [Bienertia sinuspersici]
MTLSIVVVPELLLNNHKCVNITKLQGNNDEVNLVGYILKNATVLNELLMRFYVDGAASNSVLNDKGFVLQSVPKSKE